MSTSIYAINFNINIDSKARLVRFTLIKDYTTFWWKFVTSKPLL